MEKEFGYYEADNIAVIAACDDETRWSNHKKALLHTLYNKDITDVIYNSAMYGRTDAQFAFYTEPNLDMFYSMEYEGITINDVIDMLTDYGYKAIAIRTHPTVFLINISWEDRMDEARETIANVPE